MIGRRRRLLADDGGPPPEPRLPYPDGWFAVAFGGDVPAGTVARVALMGREVVVYRTRAGLVRVVEAHCPHLGAHLGRGGFVTGEELVCPFHHFAFDPSGACVRTPYGTPPPRARLRQLPTVERNGAILVWQHGAGDAPTWQVPQLPTAGFPPPMRRRYRLVDHPQDVVENAIDIGHIGPLHHYRNVRIREPFAPDGHLFRIGPAAQRVFPVVGAIDVVFDIEAYGLGCIAVTAELPQLRSAALFQAYATPVDPCRIDLRFSVSLRAGGPRAGRALLSRLLTGGLSPAFWRDLSLDFPIWEHKRYVERPRLAKGDGPIIAYRRWASRFYSRPGEPTAASPAASVARER